MQSLANSANNIRRTLRTWTNCIIRHQGIAARTDRPECSFPARRWPNNQPRTKSERGLSSLVNEALLRSPIIAAAKAHWQASTKVPRRVSTIPDPRASPFSNSLWAGPSRSKVTRAVISTTADSVSCRTYPDPASSASERNGRKTKPNPRASPTKPSRVKWWRQRETYFNLFFLARTKDLLSQTHEQLQRVERISDSQYQLGMGQQQDVLKAHWK